MKNFFSSVLSFLLVLVLMAGSGFGVWFFMNKKVKELTEADNTNSVVEFETEDDLKDFINDVIAENQAQETPAEVVDLDHEYLRAYVNGIYEKILLNKDNCLNNLKVTRNFTEDSNDDVTPMDGTTYTLSLVPGTNPSGKIFLYELRPEYTDALIYESYKYYMLNKNDNTVSGENDSPDIIGKHFLNSLTPLWLFAEKATLYLNSNSNIVEAKLFADGTVKYKVVENFYTTGYSFVDVVEYEIEISPEGMFKRVHSTTKNIDYKTTEDAEKMYNPTSISITQEEFLTFEYLAETPQEVLDAYAAVVEYNEANS